MCTAGLCGSRLARPRACMHMHARRPPLWAPGQRATGRLGPAPRRAAPPRRRRYAHRLRWVWPSLLPCSLLPSLPTCPLTRRTCLLQPWRLRLRSATRRGRTGGDATRHLWRRRRMLEAPSWWRHSLLGLTLASWGDGASSPGPLAAPRTHDAPLGRSGPMGGCGAAAPSRPTRPSATGSGCFPHPDGGCMGLPMPGGLLDGAHASGVISPADSLDPGDGHAQLRL